MATNGNAPRVHILTEDAELIPDAPPAPAAEKAPAAKPSAPTPAIDVKAVKVLAPAQPVSTTRSPEELAAGKLRLADNFLANGLKDQARKVLEQIIKDFPNTKTAAQAEKELQELAPPEPQPAK
jgi:hypothetical protein